jgi:hypothetical protein
VPPPKNEMRRGVRVIIKCFTFLDSAEAHRDHKGSRWRYYLKNSKSMATSLEILASGGFIAARSILWSLSCGAHVIPGKCVTTCSRNCRLDWVSRFLAVSTQRSQCDVVQKRGVFH